MINVSYYSRRVVSFGQMVITMITYYYYQHIILYIIYYIYILIFIFMSFCRI